MREPLRPSDEERIRRRASFDGVADVYDWARPNYPDALLADLLAESRLDSSTRVLEIGCGPGLLTRPLAETGASLTAVELGPNLAALARARLSGFPEVHVVEADFDRWDAPQGAFDLVVAATAFHWLDPERRVDACARALVSGGRLAIVDTHWGVGAEAGRFQFDVQECYARWNPGYDPSFVPRTLQDLPIRRPELERPDLFESPRLRRYSVMRRYSAEEYCGLVQTFSDILRIESERRAQFVNCVARLIETRFGGAIERTDTYDLWVVRKRNVGRRNE